MNHVIIGNSFAGLFAVEAIRRCDADGDVTVISREPQHVYSRAMIHEMLAGLVQEQMVYLRGWDFYRQMRAHSLLGYEATAIDTAAHTVTVADEQLPYDRLLIAAGSNPFVPAIDGLGANGDGGKVEYHTFTTLEEARLLKAACAGRENAVVLGAGLIGLQCAEALRHVGLGVTVVEMADMVLPMAVDAPASDIIASELEDEGIFLRTSNTIKRVESANGRPTACELRSGEVVPCDLLVIAVGVRANTGLAQAAGITVQRGIVVNSRMETSAADVYAAGDCAQAPEIISGMTMTIPVIPIATTQGMIAGYNMAGRDRVYRGGLSLNALQFGGVQVVSYGFVKDEADAEVLRHSDPARKIYKKVIIKDNRITGALFVRDIDRAGIFRHLIENRIDVRPFKEHLLSPDFGVAHLPREERDRMFTTPQ